MNPGNLLSYEFKGLYETIDAFIELQKEYDNLELVVRSIVPDVIKEKCKKYPPYDLANISQQYKHDVEDWEYLCRKCHMLKDGRLEKFLTIYNWNNMESV